MSHSAIAAALALDDVSAGERLAAFSLASFADRSGRACPGTPAAAARAGLARSAYLQARDRLARRGLLRVEVAATGRGRASVLALLFAAAGPWWDGEINAQLFEAVLGYSGSRGPARLLVAAMAALADGHGVVQGLTTERLCSAAGVADRTYRRARATLLASGEVVLRSGLGGRGNTNCWEVPDPRRHTYSTPQVRRRRRFSPPAGARPLMATVTGAADLIADSKGGQDRTLPVQNHLVLTGVPPLKGGQRRTVSGESPAQTPAETPAAHARAGSEPQNPRTGPPSPPEGGSATDRAVVEETYVTDRGRTRRRKVSVELGPIRARLQAAGEADHAAWERIRVVLIGAVGENTFEIWLASLELLAVDLDGTLLVAGPAEKRGWVADRFGRILDGAAQQVGRQMRVAGEPERAAAEALGAVVPVAPAEASPDTSNGLTVDRSVNPSSYTDAYNQLKEVS